MHDIAHAAADAARVPHFDDVLAKGRRHRARTQGLAVGAAALAVATIIGVTRVVGGGDGGRPEPAPSPDVPTGSAATNIPYEVDDTLHIGDRAIDSGFGGPYYAAGTSIVGAVDEEGASEYYLVEDDELVPIASSDHLAIGTLSRDGELFVILEQTSNDSNRLIALDVDSRSEIASVDIPLAADSRGFLPVGIDLDHRFFLSDRRTALMWVPGEDPIPMTGVDASHLQAWPGGLAVSVLESNESITELLGVDFGTVDDRGRFSKVGTLPPEYGSNGTWSPDGEVFVAYEGPQDSGDLVMNYADGRKSETVHLPAPGFWMPVSWESDTQLVMTEFGEQPDASVAATVGDLARCDVVALTCTRIEDIPEGPVEWAGDSGRP